MDLRKLQKAAFASDCAHRQVAHLCNNIGPRFCGSPQAQKAVDYVAAEMKALGLDVRIEPVLLRIHHTAADTFDKVDPHQLQENAAVVAVTAYGLANLEQPLPR